jgi:hypothetical protein
MRGRRRRRRRRRRRGGSIPRAPERRRPGRTVLYRKELNH